MKAIVLIGMIFLFCSFGLNILTDQSLVAYYPMTEQTGNIVRESKNRDFLTGVNSPYIKNASAYTNGTTSYFEANNHFAFKALTNKMTVSYWTKKSLSTSGGFMAAVDLITSPNFNIWNVQHAPAGQFQMVISTSPTVISGKVSPTVSYTSTGVWRHFAAVYDGTLATASDRIKIYVNGVDVGGSMTGTIPTTLLNPTNSTFRVGRGLGGYIGDSYLKFIEVYNRSLTPTEIMQIYSNEINKLNQTK
jgi:hypothetical protein